MQRLWETTRGNALFLRELVSQGLERGTLSADTGVWRWTADPSQPRTVPPARRVARRPLANAIARRVAAER